jgi:hypothetical protein
MNTLFTLLLPFSFTQIKIITHTKLISLGLFCCQGNGGICCCSGVDEIKEGGFKKTTF